ncbi:FkbM family methyltransferase [Aquimarina sp. MMG016]|uniref:FkbM family methyltransferase n=1 Tax=Aquimarina sp. MMG016 TaxID=2822690 RepID=UPI001B3A4BE4|nr:FkbM family methyltransferase [Aquimarina sp. MMG016]MBQ4820093.1 FkbM family methyltransferase [Aquimarina sp. MMG016]
MKNRVKFIILKMLVRLRKMILGPHAIGVQYETKNGIINAPIEDLTVGRHLGFKGNWDIAEIEELLKFINQKDVVYFLGTHIGTLLIPMSKKCNKVVGYEANPDNLKFLNWNINANNVSNVIAFNYAIGDTEKNITFYKNKINSGGSKIKPLKESFLYNYDNPEVIEIPMVSLDHHIESKKLPAPSCIVVDIEGAEYFALQGMQETLAKTRVLYIEYVPHHLKNVANVSNKNFIDLIFPYFDKVKLIRTQEEIKIEDSSEELLQFLDGLASKNKSDDLLFTKNS